MADLHRRVEVPHTGLQVYSLVADVESYPEFLPWMREAKILARTEDFVEASLEVHSHGTHSRYTTRHWLEHGDRVHMELIDGPMRQLDSIWTFTDESDAKSIIDLQVEYEFNNPISAMLFGHLFRISFDSMLEHVIERADELHG